MSRYSVKRKIKFDKSPCCCLICKRVFNGEKALKCHITQMHTDKNLSNVKRGRPFGTKAWNVGLTKETSEIIKSQAKQASDDMLSGKRVNAFKGKKHTDDTKRIISEKLSKNNKGGRCKWYIVDGQKVQGTWERDLAIILSERNIKWKKLNLNNNPFKYEMGGKVRNYTPDFYLEEYDLYVEVKGHWWGNDKEKMIKVICTYPDIKFLVIRKEEFEEIKQGLNPWNERTLRL